MEELDSFYSTALEHFRELGGSEEELKWLVATRLAWSGLYLDEVRLRLKLIEEVSERVRGRVLDVGSGSGFPALVMAKRAESVLGVERERTLVEFARKLAALSENLTFIEGDFLNLELSEKFDTVVFLYILHDFEPEPFLEIALRLLKLRGRIIVGDFDLNGLGEKLRLFAAERGMRIIEEKTLGMATSHGKEADAFIIVMEAKE
ncbi:class I SAM-dependent methyltransferase [Thermococcus sp.]